MAFEGVQASAHFPARDRDRLANQQLRLALGNMKPNVWFVPIFGLITCAMFSRWIAWQTLAAWWICVTLGGLPLRYISAKILALPETRLRERHWSYWALAAFSLSTITWTSLAFILWVPGDDLNHMIVLLILACSLAGIAALIGASRPLITAGLVLYGVTLVLCPLQQGGLLYDGLSLLAFFYVCYLAHLSRNFYATARDMLLLRDDKDELIAALAEAKVESDAARLRAERASQTKSQFLANMSHELRTPLNAIIGFSEMINSGLFEKKIPEYSRLIYDSGHHLLALINDILDLAKIEAGALVLRETDIDLRLLIADCVSLMEPKTIEGGVRIVQDVPANLPHIVGDDRALRQVFINLLSNAVKFTPPGGRIDVEAFVQDDGWLALSVIDTGTGIAEEDLQRVFENFGQGRADVAIAEKGTGLGLPIVKGLVAAHGGSIALRSVPGDGTNVTIILPAERVLTTAAAKLAS